MSALHKLQLIALTGLLMIVSPVMAADAKDATADSALQAGAKDAHKKNMAEPKYCPKQITKADITGLSAAKKMMINNHEFHVGKKFDLHAGKRYMELNKAGKAPDAVELKSEKIKGDKAVCMYMYQYKGPSKKDAKKEVEQKARIRMHTMIAGGKPGAEPAPAADKK
jgi:hypothetical protein